jgi:hypothetical protein
MNYFTIVRPDPDVIETFKLTSDQKVMKFREFLKVQQQSWNTWKSKVRYFLLQMLSTIEKVFLGICNSIA